MIFDKDAKTIQWERTIFFSKNGFEKTRYLHVREREREEETLEKHTQKKRPGKDAVHRQPSASQGERPEEKTSLPVS